MSADPDADDYKWLVARERGEDIGHVAAADREAYERIGALIGDGVAPRPGFRQRVLDAIDAAERDELRQAPAAPATEAPVVPLRPQQTVPEAEVEQVAEVAQVAEIALTPRAAKAAAVPLKQAQAARRKGSRWPWIAGGMAAAAAAVTVLAIVPGRDASVAPSQKPDLEVIALATELRRGGPVRRAAPERGDEASIGDTLVVRAETPGPAEVRVYGGLTGRLLATCNDGGGCTVERDGERRRFTLEVKLEVPGEVRAVVFLGPSIPAPAGTLDADLEAAAGAGIRAEPGPPTRVL